MDLIKEPILDTSEIALGSLASPKTIASIATRINVLQNEPLPDPLLTIKPPPSPTANAPKTLIANKPAPSFIALLD